MRLRGRNKRMIQCVKRSLKLRRSYKRFKYMSKDDVMDCYGLLEIVKKIAILQARLNNHLVKNPVDRPIRVAFDQPDMTDLFSAVSTLLNYYV